MNKVAIQIGTGVGFTLREVAYAVARLAKKLLSKDIEPSFDATALEGDKGRVSDMSRATNILGWTAQVLT